MQNFIKRDLVLTISEEQPNLTQAEIFTIIQKTLDKIIDSLANGRNIELRNFGVFEVVLRRQKPGRNPMRPEIEVPVPERAAVKFSAGKIMRERVLQLTEKMKQAS